MAVVSRTCNALPPSTIDVPNIVGVTPELPEKNLVVKSLLSSLKLVLSLSPL